MANAAVQHKPGTVVLCDCEKVAWMPAHSGESL